MITAAAEIEEPQVSMPGCAVTSSGGWSFGFGKDAHDVTTSTGVKRYNGSVIDGFT